MPTDPSRVARSYMLPPNLRNLGVYVERDTRLYRLCRVTFSTGNGSIYLLPTSPTGRYAYGHITIPEGVDHHEFSTADQFVTGEGVGLKMSLHPDGGANIHSSEPRSRTPRATGRRLDTLRGEHVATVMTGDVETLKPWTKPLIEIDGAKSDRVIPLTTSDAAVRLAIYLNGVEPAFGVPSVVGWLELIRRELGDSPLFVGLAATTTPREPALGEGVVAIGGWDVHAMRSTEASAEMLYLRSV